MQATESEQSLKIDYDRVRSFLNGTRDPNKELHRTWALGFQLELILKQLADEAAQKGQQCALMRTIFSSPVQVDSTVRINPPKKIDISQSGKLKGFNEGFTIDLCVGEQQAASSSFFYKQPTPAGTAPIQGHLFELTQYRAKQTGYGIFKTTPDYQAEAIGLASNALFQDGRKLVKQKQKEGKDPIYFAHVLTLTPELFELQNGNKIRILTNARDSTEGRDRYSMEVVATKEDGKILYTGQLNVTFKNTKQR